MKSRAKQITGIFTIFMAACVIFAGTSAVAQQYEYTPPAYSPPGYETPTYYTPSPPSYTKTNYYTNTSCEAVAFSLDRDEQLLKDMYQNNKCTEVPYNYKPDLRAVRSGTCFYKWFGVSCSSVNDDCKYVDAKSYCPEEDIDCEMITQVQLWNRPMKDGGDPITYESIIEADDVINTTAEQSKTSTKPIKDQATHRHSDREVWWREVYYFCRQGNVADNYPYYMHKKKLERIDMGENWVRGEVGHECKCEARVGYYFYKGVREHEAEWTLPDAAPEKWREYEKGAMPQTVSPSRFWWED